MLFRSEDPEYGWYQPLIRAAIDSVERDPTIEVVVLVGAVRALYQLPSESSFELLPSSNSGDVVKDGLNTVVDRLVTNGKKVILYVDNPPLSRPEDCLQRRTRLGFLEDLVQNEVSNCVIARSVFDAQTAGYLQDLNDVVDAYPGQAFIFDPNDVYFDQLGYARHITDGVMMFSFTDHPSDAAAEIIGQRLNLYISRQ